MFTTDSISIFAEGTFVEQIQELVTFISRSIPETERPAFLQPFQDALKSEDGSKSFEEDSHRRQQVLTKVVGALGEFDESTEKESEGFFNLLIAHLLNSFPSSSTELAKHISRVSQIVIDKLPSDQSHLKYRILANIFNAIPRRSILRLNACKTLLVFSAGNEELDIVQFSPSDVDRWLNEWEASSAEKSEFLKFVAETLVANGRTDVSYAYFVSYVKSISSPSPSTTSAVLDLIAAALRSPTNFGFDTLFGLDQVQAQKSHPLYELLVIFANGGLKELKAWEDVNVQTAQDFKLDSKQLSRKLKLLILSSLGFSRVGQNISYSEIATALGVETSEVEKWVIDAIRAGLLSGKLSQTTHTLHVSRASSREFGHSEWAALEGRLLAWKNGLSGIRGVLSAARQNGGIPSGLFERPAVAQEQVA